MKTFIVYAERTILESVEIQANTETEALTKALDSEEWEIQEDKNWEITNATEVDFEEYDEFGVNQRNTFNTETT
jgi:hypothetical protein